MPGMPGEIRALLPDHPVVGEALALGTGRLRAGLGRAGRTRAEARFSERTMHEGYHNLYREMLRDRALAPA